MALMVDTFASLWMGHVMFLANLARINRENLFTMPLRQLSPMVLILTTLPRSLWCRCRPGIGVNLKLSMTRCVKPAALTVETFGAPLIDMARVPSYRSLSVIQVVIPLQGQAVVWIRKSGVTLRVRYMLRRWF